MPDSILIVDDEQHIIDLAKLYLEQESYKVSSATDGKTALQKILHEKPNLVVLDLMLPELDGWEVCRRVRAESDVPIIMLTARSDDIDRIVGLELGADDYLTKPFNPRELVARVRAILRRTGRPTPTNTDSTIMIDNLVIHPERRVVMVDSKEVDLRMKEFDLLMTLATNPGMVFTREKLLDIVWGYDFAGETRTVDVHIAHLRHKLKGMRPAIDTVWGVGYRLDALMLHGLRARLFVSYLLLLVVTLTVISAALFFILNTRAAPPEPTYEQLATIALNVNLRDVLNSAGFNLLFPTQSDFDNLTSALSKVAQQQRVRVLLVNLENQNVLYDSAGAFAANSTLDGQIENYAIPAAITRNVFTQVSAARGMFTNPADQVNWLFVGIESLRQRQNTFALLFADPQPTQTLQDALAQFGAQLFPLLIQAAVAGLVIAILLAVLITRSIARPLQTVAKAAAAVADGHYNQAIPIRGPEEVQAVAQAFNSMSDKVQAEQRSQQDFLANVSHDLKTPLTSIQGYSQAIIDGIGNPIQAATIIHEESERLNRMVLELTDLARLQAGRLSMKTDAVDLGQLTNAVAQRLSIVAREKGIELDVNAPSMPEIAGDGDRLVQVVDNLISNAIKYTPSGGKVTVRTQVRRNGVELIVEDSGQGIAATDLARIFERFYQVDKARGPQRGTGLGLAIVQEIVQAHGGTITASSPGENRGSTFTVWLPSPNLSTVVRRR